MTSSERLGLSVVPGTGWSAEDIRSVMTAFGAFAGDKANHRPITLLRPANGKDWIRIEGFASADTLAGELRGLRAEK